MALKPEDRYASAQDLSAEIEHWLADEPVAAYREPLVERLGRWGRRHRPVVASAVALMLSAVLALGGCAGGPSTHLPAPRRCAASRG